MRCSLSHSPVISIVINNYNYARYLSRAIASAIAQTYQRREIIVVDDGSTDNSLEVAAEFGDAIRVVAKPNGGQASAFNRGFVEARGDWILFLDADDELYPEALNRVARLTAPGVCKIHYPLQIFYSDSGREVIGALLPSKPLSEGNVLPLIAKSGNYCWPPTSGNVFSKQCLARILPMEEESFRICADLYLCLKIAPHGEMRALSEPQGMYRIHGGNNHTRFSLEPAALRKRVRAYIQHDRLTAEVAGLATRGMTWLNREAFEGALLARRFGDLGQDWGDLPDYMMLKAFRKATLAARPMGVYHRVMEQMTWTILRHGGRPLVEWWLRLRNRKARAARI